MIGEELKSHSETWNDVVALTLVAHELDIEFDRGYGGPEGKPFTLWTNKRVYFPTQYDGAENVASVPRYPSDEPTYHVGSGGGEWRDGLDDDERTETYEKGWVAIPKKWVKTW